MGFQTEFNSVCKFKNMRKNVEMARISRRDG